MRNLKFQGLSSNEAARRLAQYGPNEQPRAPPPGIFAIALRTLKEPMFFLLASAALLYLFVGDLGEGLFMVAGAGASITLVILQELRTERALEALNRLAEPTATCLRDGVERRIPARDLVPGDLILVGEGERAPADAVLVGGDALVIDEFLLTGESAPVTKTLAGEAAFGGIPRSWRRAYAFSFRRNHDRARIGAGRGRAHRRAHGDGTSWRLARRD